MRNVVTALCLSLIIGSAVLAQDGKNEALSGNVQPVQVTELKIELEGYNGELRIKSLLSPGASVKEGDTIAELEAPDYEDALARAKENLTLSQNSVQGLEDAMKYATESYKLRLASAKRNAERSAERYDHFINESKARSIRNSEMGLEGYQNNIADQEDELAQLTSLYKGNDLAKESQDIVLDRSKRRLKTTKERYEMAKKSHDRLLKVDMVRREEDMLADKLSSALELTRVESASAAGNFDLEGKLTRARRGLEDAQKSLKKLEDDAGKMKLIAPHAGLVAIGGWGGNDGAQTPHKVGDKASRGQVLATIVDQTRLTLSVNVALDVRSKFSVGTAVVVGDDKLAGKVTALGFVVNKGGMVTANIEVENAEGKLLPGQKVSIALP